MRVFARALPNQIVTYCKAELVAVALIAATVALWAASAAGSFSIRALIACEVVFFSFYLVGSLCASVRALANGVLFDLPLRLLVGYGIVNTALLVLAWISPLGIVGNFGILLAIATGAFFATGERKHARGASASLWVVALCLVATTLWCQDSIHPRAEQGPSALFKPWADGFYHAIHIRMFGASHGASSVEDWRLAGVPARPYHYGIYMLPAFIKQASGIPSYAAFAGVLAPVGVFFTGLAAYAFFGSLWGVWPGVAAAAALLALPDGAQQGMRNPFMSYHWLTQISPSATYGLALLVVAWLFVIQGCARGSRLQLLTGWMALGIVSVYKLHYVVASALLFLVIPAMFFSARVRPRRRALWVVSACVAYGVALIFAQKVPGVPLIRFDGSAVGEILRLVQSFAKSGAVRDYALQHMGAQFPWTSNLLFGIPYILLATLGLFLPLLVILMVHLRRRAPLLEVLFPLLLIANFLVMFFGLALDFESSTPDELSHRPVLIVYFFVVAWVGGAAGLALIESPRLKGIARPAILGVALALMVVPLRFGSGVQQMWAMRSMAPVRLPVSLVRVAEYIHDHGGRDDVFQDSQFDRLYAVAALAERRTFVTHTLTRMPFRGELVEARTNAIDHFMGLRRAHAVVATARTFGFRWFLLEPGDRVEWPAEIVNKPVFEAGPFKLYEF